MKRFCVTAMLLMIGVAIMTMGGCFVDADLSLGGRDTSLNSEYGHDLSGASFISGGILNTYIFARITKTSSYNFIKDIKKVEDNTHIRTMRVFINSRGGGLFDGLSISDAIGQARDRGWVVEAHAYGIVASAAVTILAVCSPRYASRGTVFMVHELRNAPIDYEDMLREGYMSYILDNSYLSRDSLSDKMLAETYFTARQALEWGLIDGIR
jgi:ATP-dependent protease ClpP protease subunit